MFTSSVPYNARLSFVHTCIFGETEDAAKKKKIEINRKIKD